MIFLDDWDDLSKCPMVGFDDLVNGVKWSGIGGLMN